MTPNPRLLLVGGFDTGNPRVKGGQVAACVALLNSDLAKRCEILPIDSTQFSHPPPSFSRRGLTATVRTARFLRTLVVQRPHAALLFCSDGLSFYEKCLLALIGRVAGCPSILAMRSGHFMRHVRESRAFRWAARQLLRIPARILCQGPSWKTFYQQHLGVPERKLAVVFNWIEPRPYLTVPAVERGTGAFCVLFVGWLDRAKGVYELVEAITDHPDLRDAHLHLLGHGYDAEILKAKVNQAGADDRVTFHGWTTEEEKQAYFCAADVLALPSHAEGFPNVILEAMAAGLPVVTTAVGSIPDVIEDRRNGLIVDTEDAAGLGNALAALKRSPELRADMGSRNRSQLLRNHLPQVAVPRLWRILAQLSPAFSAELPSDTGPAAADRAPPGH